MAETKRAVIIVPDIVDDFTDDHTLALFVWLICKANRSDKPYPWKLEDGTVINLQKNQAFLNVTAYAKRRGVSRKVARDCLDSLKRRATIGTQEVHRKGLIITVVNLDKYQTLANYAGGGAASRAASGPQEGPPYHVVNHVVNHERRAREFNPSDPQFERDFWDAYPPIPNKANANKRKAEAEWVKLTPELQSQAVAAVRVFAAVVMAQPANRRVKLIGPAAFLDNRCFSTDPAAWDPECEPPKIESRSRFIDGDVRTVWFKWVGERQLGPFDTRAEAEAA